MPPRRIPAFLAVAAAIVAGCGGTGAPSEPTMACACVIGGIWVGVIDARTGAILPDASVSVAGPACAGDRCSCQPGGFPERQFLCSVPDGTYTVTAQASGYVAASVDATVVSSGPAFCHCQVPTRVTVPLSR